VPPRGLPGNANLEHLKKGAKSFQRAVRSGDSGATEVVREFHPGLGHASAGSPELTAFSRADAQLVVARRFGFASWPKLKSHLELVAPYARSPHEQPSGPSLTEDIERVDEFLRLACLTYGGDHPDRWGRARGLLVAHPELARFSIHTMVVAGDAAAARSLLERDPSQASLQGGPHAWEPLLYLAYSRLGCIAPRMSALDTARLLLAHGADPDAGYLWEGLIPPFTALTGVFGSGTGDAPAHPDSLPFARLLLEAGADPNDAQTMYNRQWDPDDAWLELLFEFGLGTGDGGPWRRLIGARQASPRQMLEDLLITAAHHGFLERVRLLLARGVDPTGAGTSHPIYEGRTPVQEAALGGYPEIVSLLTTAGAGKADQVETLLAAVTAGDRRTVEGLLEADAGLTGRAIGRHPDQLIRAAEKNSLEAVALLIELGFDVNTMYRTAPLHEAAMRGNLAMIRLLLEHGADPNARDRSYDATPAGWAEHHNQTEAERYLRRLEH
jgi:ankyrin repeat protein